MLVNASSSDHFASVSHCDRAPSGAIFDTLEYLVLPRCVACDVDAFRFEWRSDPRHGVVEFASTVLPLVTV